MEEIEKIEKKNKGGRPTLYKKEYCEMLIEHMKQGYSFDSFAALIPDNTVHVATIYEWRNKNPEFDEAHKRGKACSLLKWEKIGIDLTEGKIVGGNVACWIFNMKNRFGWIDSHTQKIETDNSSLAEKFAAALKRTKSGKKVSSIKEDKKKSKRWKK